MQEVFAVQSTLANAFNSRVTDGVVRLGLNYKFDRDDPVAVKY
jgi:hypothetical protein